MKNFGIDFTVKDILEKIPEILIKGKAAELKKCAPFVHTIMKTQVINII